MISKSINSFEKGDLLIVKFNDTDIIVNNLLLTLSTYDDYFDKIIETQKNVRGIIVNENDLMIFVKYESFYVFHCCCIHIKTNSKVKLSQNCMKKI